MGDEICRWGGLARGPDGDWFDPPLQVPAIGYGSEGPPPRPSSDGIPVEEADFDAVEHRYERDGQLRFRQDLRHALRRRYRHAHHTNERPEHAFRRCSDPPWEPPPGGRPQGTNGRCLKNLDGDLGDVENAGAAITTVIFPPSDDQTVLIVAAAESPPYKRGCPHCPIAGASCRAVGLEHNSTKRRTSPGDAGPVGIHQTVRHGPSRRRCPAGLRRAQGVMGNPADLLLQGTATGRWLWPYSSGRSTPNTNRDGCGYLPR